MGVPNFTTDTAAVNRAIELEADLLLKGTHGGADGIYTADPRTDSSARKLNTVTYDSIVRRRLGVMDGTAFTLARDATHKLSLVVCDIKQPNNLEQIISGHPVGTLVSHEGRTQLATTEE